MSNTISQIKAELKKVEDAYFYNVYEKQQITNLTKALSVAVTTLDRITDLHCDDGTIMQSRSYEAIQDIAEILSSGGKKL